MAYVAAPVGNVAADGTATTTGTLYVNGRVARVSPADVLPPPRDAQLYVGGHPDAAGVGAGFHGIGGTHSHPVTLCPSSCSACE